MFFLTVLKHMVIIVSNTYFYIVGIYKFITEIRIESKASVGRTSAPIMNKNKSPNVSITIFIENTKNSHSIIKYNFLIPHSNLHLPTHPYHTYTPLPLLKDVFGTTVHMIILIITMIYIYIYK